MKGVRYTQYGDVADQDPESNSMMSTHRSQMSRKQYYEMNPVEKRGPDVRDILVKDTVTPCLE